MRSAHFKFVLRTSKKDRRDLAPIFLRIISYYNVKYVSVGRQLQERFWNKERGQVRRNHPDSAEINEYLEHFLRIAEEAISTRVQGARTLWNLTFYPSSTRSSGTIIKQNNFALVRSTLLSETG